MDEGIVRSVDRADDDSIPIAESTRLDDFDIPPSLDTPSQRSTAEYDSRESLEDNRKFLLFFLLGVSIMNYYD